MVVLSCILAPYLLAFGTDNYTSSNLNFLDTSVSCVFLIDLILNFFTAYFSDELDIIDDHSVRVFD